MIDLTLRRYWQQLTAAEDVRVIQAAADETEHLLASERNKTRLTDALEQARTPYTSHWYK